MENREKDQIKQIEESLRMSVVKNRSISHELKNSFMEYAMSVIVSRALPDARDGLKPVHRRALFAANELGMTHDRPYKKAARIVGEIIGKYHPHGDVAVYETIVRMAQDFSLRYPLIDGHGNFGSIDGDSAAAMRYTEVRMSRIAEEMLRDIKRDTVDFVDNYDGSEKEPVILPAYIPNLLLNGSSGIAVGMATNIPPHNLQEIIDGIILLANKPETTCEELMEIIKGPDFPTGAEIIGRSGINDYFSTGRGCVTIRSKIEIEKHEGRNRLVVTEIPYEIKKTAIIERIVELVNTDQLTGIADIRDESSREGIRLVIDLKRDVIPEVLLNHLYKHTQLQSNFNVNMLALVNGEPRLLDIRQVLKIYLDHQVDVLTRKYNFELKKNKDRVHILEGLLKAVNNIREVIKIITDSASADDALNKLINQFTLSKIQAQAVLEMRLRVLSGLERNKLQAELDELLKIIKNLEAVLGSHELKLKVIIDNLTKIKETFSDERRTLISYDAVSDIDDESLIPVEDIVVTLSNNGYLKRISVDSYKTQNRGGVGVTGTSTYSDDEIEKILITSTHTDLLFFTNKGKVYRLRGYMIPSASKIAKGTPAVNLIRIEKDEKVLSILPIEQYENGYIMIITLDGIIKRMSLDEFKLVRSTGKIAITLRPGDSLYNACCTTGDEEIFVGTYLGNLVRFNETNVRMTGRSASGVLAAKVEHKKDRVVGLSSSNQGKYLLTISQLGYGKITDSSEYRLTKRGAKGVRTMRVTPKTGKVVSTLLVNGDEDLLLLTIKGKIIRINLSNFRNIGRFTSGVKLINLKEQNKIVSAAVFKNNKEIEIGEFEEIYEENEDVKDQE